MGRSISATLAKSAGLLVALQGRVSPAKNRLKNGWLEQQFPPAHPQEAHQQQKPHGQV